MRRGRRRRRNPGAGVALLVVGGVGALAALAFVLYRRSEHAGELVTVATPGGVVTARRGDVPDARVPISFEV